MKIKIAFVLLFLLLSVQFSKAQTNIPFDLFEQLKAMDSQIFDEGFNKCDMKKLEAAIADDIEFIHDRTGVSDRAEFFKAIKENVCSNPEMKPIRKLVEGSLEVFPLFNGDELYGAIQTGDHLFYISTPGKEPVLTGKAKFTHVWYKVDSKWTLKRVLSYDHRPAGGGD